MANALFGRVLREPFLHVFLLGGLVFWFLSSSDPVATVDPANCIVISSAEVERIAVVWSQRWKRPPTEAELTGMVNEAIREELP